MNIVNIKIAITDGSIISVERLNIVGLSFESNKQTTINAQNLRELEIDDAKTYDFIGEENHLKVKGKNILYIIIDY